MSFGLSGAAIAGIAAAGASVYTANKQANAAEDAANAQAAAAGAGQTTNAEQFAAIQKLLSPYVQGGEKALTAQLNLMGLNGADAQKTAISGIESSPTFQAMLKQGETSILQNASATGGIRGGNTEAALAQFSPQLLSKLIQEQYTNLGGLTSVGQNAAAGVGNAGMTTANNIAQLQQQAGAALAGNALAQGNAASNYMNAISSGIGVYRGLGGGF